MNVPNQSCPCRDSLVPDRSCNAVVAVPASTNLILCDRRSHSIVIAVNGELLVHQLEMVWLHAGKRYVKVFVPNMPDGSRICAFIEDQILWNSPSLTPRYP